MRKWRLSVGFFDVLMRNWEFSKMVCSLPEWTLFRQGVEKIEGYQRDKISFTGKDQLNLCSAFTNNLENDAVNLVFLPTAPIVAVLFQHNFTDSLPTASIIGPVPAAFPVLNHSLPFSAAFRKCKQRIVKTRSDQ